MLHITSNEERMILFRNNKSIINQTSKLSNIMQDYQLMFHITSNEERMIHTMMGLGGLETMNIVKRKSVLGPVEFPTH